MAIGAMQTHRETGGAETAGRVNGPRPKQKAFSSFGHHRRCAMAGIRCGHFQRRGADAGRWHRTVSSRGRTGTCRHRDLGRPRDTDYVAQLARIQRHSARLVVIVLDLAAMRSQWKRLADQNQIVCLVALPFTAESLTDAMGRAYDEYRLEPHC